MPSTSPAYPSSAAQLGIAGGGTVIWQNITNILSSNDSHATSTHGGGTGTTTRQLRAYFDAISLAGAVVGIEVGVEIKTNLVLLTAISQIVLLSANTGAVGDAIGTDQSGTMVGAIGTTDSVVTFGGPTNLWGVAPADLLAYITGGQLGVGFRVLGKGETVSADALHLTIYFSTEVARAWAAIIG